MSWTLDEHPTALQYFASLVQSDSDFALMEAAISIGQDAEPDLDLQAVMADIDRLQVRLAQRLADVGVAPPPLPGAWRLRRWPEAAGLKSPGHPRLAALMTAHHYTVDELGAASGLPSLTVQWFVQCCQLFGLVEHRQAITSSASTAGTASAHNAPPGWLVQLRERLRLW